ncbi:uncharacterized protein TNCV_2328641 [Trichonephila clavipes]|nr:uncharacterized protein TNCV_2328641 [Trichonephila clavipes]
MVLITVKYLSLAGIPVLRTEENARSDSTLVGFIVIKKEYVPSREIGSRVGRIKTTVMRIYDRWMQEDTTDRRGRSHPPQCTTSREDRQIVRMAVTDGSVTSRTIAQHIESVTHGSVSSRTIQHRLQRRVVCPQDVNCLVYP